MKTMHRYFYCLFVSMGSLIAQEPLRFTSILSEPVGCNGAATGSLTIAATGGGLPYIYAVGTPGAPVPPPNSTGIFHNLVSGLYGIDVTDSLGTTVSASAPVGVTAPLTVQQTAATSVSAQGATDGTIVIVAAGGQLPLTFTITNPSTTPPLIVGRTATFTGLAAGAHTVTVNSNDGCPAATAFVRIEAPAVGIPVPLQISHTTAVAAGCNDASTGVNTGSLTLTVIGGSGNAANYRYALTVGPVTRPIQTSNVFNNLPAGQYTVDIFDVTNPFFLTSIEIPVGQVEPLTVVETDIDAIACAGGTTGTITVTTEGGHQPFTFAINPVAGSFSQPSPEVGEFASLPLGTYTVTINSADQCAVQAVTVNVAQAFEAITVSATVTPQQCLTGKLGSITVNVTGGNAPFEFSLNGSAFQESNRFVDLEAGAYTITVRDASGCIELQQETVPLIRGTTGNSLTDFISAKYCHNEC